MILVTGGIKGGSGKTTLATNLAVLIASLGKKVLLIDADKQCSTSDWAEQREQSNAVVKHPICTISLNGHTIHTQILKMKEDYDHVIVDSGGRDSMSQRSALSVADKFLIPFKPRSFDVWTMANVKGVIDEIKLVNPKLEAFCVINQGDTRGNDNEDAMQILNEGQTVVKIIPSPIGHRKSFPNAASEGLGIIELKIPDKKAIDELVQCHDFLYGSNVREIYKTHNFNTSKI